MKYEISGYVHLQQTQCDIRTSHVSGNQANVGSIFAVLVKLLREILGS